MASFLEELFNSIFTPGPTPTLLIATNGTFAVLQVLLFALLIATFSIHFVVLSLLSGGLWIGINLFAREVQAQQALQEASKRRSREKSLDADSETETEAAPIPKRAEVTSAAHTSSSLAPDNAHSDEVLRKRRSLGDSSGYVSTDSEWEKVSDAEDKER